MLQTNPAEHTLRSHDAPRRRWTRATSRSRTSRFHHVLGSMPGVAYVEAAGPTGMTSYVSPRIEELTGYPPERFTESRDFWYSLVHPDDRERVEMADVAADATSAPYLEEYRLVLAEDRVIWVRDEAVHVEASNGRAAHWIGLIVDITREKDAEARAAEVEHRYRTLVEQLPIVTYIDAPDESLTNLFVSPQIDDLLGRPSGTTGDEWAERRASRGSGAGAERDDRRCPLRRAVHARVPDGPRRRTGDLGPGLGDHGARRSRRARVRPRLLLRHHANGRRRSSSSRRSSAGTATSSSSCRRSRTWTRPTTSCPRST